MSESTFMEALSDLLRLIQLQVSVYHNAKVCGDWVINEHELGQTCFHMATEGGCLLKVPNHGTFTLNCGDLVIFPREVPHSMTPLIPLTGIQQHLDYKTDLPGIGMLCGKVLFEHQASQQLLCALPPVFVIPNDEHSPWLTKLLTLIQIESYEDSQGSKVILDKLSELLFTYAIRHYLKAHSNEAGVLALYAHPKLAAVVNAIHGEPQRNWHLEQLAAIALQSRTAFAESFRKTSGWTPMQYITWWRMQLAWSMLSKGKNVASTAEHIGYQSESAFSRAFKKQFSISAGAVRRKIRGQP